jgi:flagellar hook-length control protein FliK
MAGLDASNSAGNSTASATPVALANTESNAGTSSQAKTQGNVQQGANTFLNTGYAGEFLNGNSTAAGIVATNAEIGKNATAHVTSPESGAVSGAAAQSAASVKSVTQEIVAGHEFLRSIANPQSDTQPVIAQTTTGNADTLSSNGLSVVRGLSAKNGSATNSEAASAQAVLQQASGKLDVNANQQTMVNPAMHNVVANQVKATDVTLQNQIKQLIGAKQQPEISALQAANNPIDTPSSNVYHVTTNGIITANSTSLNAAPLSDLAIAPRTVLLDQPGADQALAENLRWAVNEKLSRLTVNVSPANLGPISVSVDVENQNMSVSIVTNNTIAKEAIDNILPRMREHFSSEGYQQVSVDVSSQQERNSNLRNQTADSFHDQSESGSDSRQAETTLVHLNTILPLSKSRS